MNLANAKIASRQDVLEWQATLRAAILANTDPDVIAAREIRNDTELARLYNVSSTFIVWRTAVPVSEYRDAVVWTEVDALTAGSKYRIWEWLTGNMTLPLEPAKTPVRQGLADCWGSATTTRAQLLAIAKRPATKAERLFATGTGTSGSPGALVWEGMLSISDVGAAMTG